MQVIQVNKIPDRLRSTYERQYPLRRQIEIDDMIFEICSVNVNKGTISLKLVAVIVPDSVAEKIKPELKKSYEPTSIPS